MGKAAILLTSHLFCIAAGGAWIRSNSASSAEAQGNSAAAKSGERSPRPASTASAEGGALVERALSVAKPAPLAAESLAKLAAAYAPGDGEKAVRRLTEDGLSRPPAGDEFSAAFLAWFRDDPKAALQFVLKLEGMSDDLLKLALAGVPLEQHLDLAKQLVREGGMNLLLQLLGARLAELPPAEAAAFFNAQLGEASERSVARSIIRGWPNDPEGFLKFALAVDNNATLIRDYLTYSRNPWQASALLTLLDSRSDLPESIQKLLAEGGELRGHLYRYADPSVPLDKRIAEMANLAWLKDATPEKLREGALKQISTVDINELMRNGPDYRYAFRHGAMTADEILDAVKAKFPELAAASDYETRVRVFNELASEDAAAAYSLISHLPEEVRNLAVIHQSRWTFRDTSPDAFFAMINLAPGPDSTEATTQRADAWQNYGSSAYAEYGDYYVDWVRELPPGVNRDAARASLAAAARQRKNDSLAEEFEKPASR